jgi:hypothetical protein
MRSRAVRLVLAEAAWIALAASAFLAIRSERQIATRSADLRAFDLHAHEVSDGFSSLRIAEQAYVAVGQGVVFWLPKVTQTMDATAKTIATLRQSATSIGARSALDDAAASLTEFGEIDKRVRDFLASGQTFMAGDIVFAEGHHTIGAAIEQVEAASTAEHQAFDGTYAAIRARQAFTLAGSGGFAALVILLLGLTGPGSKAEEEQISLAGLRPASSESSLGTAKGAPAVRAASPVLSAAARLCTDFGRARNLDDVTSLLARSADVMDATGIVVWLGSAASGDLQPVLAHGYSPHMLARMSPVVRSSDNAAAAAYRTGELQIVASRPDSPGGAIVAPIVSADGCIGAFSAEIRSGGEGSESVQALASIIAAQLAGIIAPPAPAMAKDRTA